MSEELKPCPFCNDEMKLDPGAASFATGPGLVYVSCDCGAMGAGGKTRAEAIEVWNRRTPPAVTAKPDLAAPVEQASKSTLSQQVAHARAEVATWPDSVRESVGIPPQQSPDPIYLIRPKAGGTTWTECISKQSHDAAMRLGVYESRVVIEVGAAAGSVRDAAIEAAARIAMDGPLLESAGESLYLNDNCKAMALMVANRIRDLKGKAQ